MKWESAGSTTSVIIGNPYEYEGYSYNDTRHTLRITGSRVLDSTLGEPVGNEMVEIAITNEDSHRINGVKMSLEAFVQLLAYGATMVSQMDNPPAEEFPDMLLEEIDTFLRERGCT